MAVLVALSFFFLLVSENMPASSKVPLIGGYYTVTMVEMAISFFLNVIVLRFHHMTHEPVPGWVKVSVLASFISKYTFKIKIRLITSSRRIQKALVLFFRTYTCTNVI